jgi:hypothetical protein
MSAAILHSRPGTWPAYVPAVPASVLSITAPTATEGAALVYTVTLNATTTASSTLPYALTGTAAPGDVGAPAFSNGVTLATSTLTIPSGVSAFTVTLPTVDDAVVEIAETAIITIGGVSATGTITDNDVASLVIEGAALLGIQPNDVADQIMRAESSGGGRSVIPHIRPQTGETIRRTNVDFHWPTREEFNQSTGDTKVWEGTIRNSVGTVVHEFDSTAGYNHHVISIDLAPGVYEWDLYDPGIPGGTAGFIVQARRFTVHADATHFDTPTRDGAYAQAVANAARTCLPANVDHYKAGGTRRANYDRMAVNYNTFKSPAALTAYGSFGIGAAEAEKTRAYVLAFLSAANNGAAEYQTEAFRRLFDPTSGLVYIDPTYATGLTYSNEDVYRPWIEAVAVLARQFWPGMSAGQKADVLTCLGDRLAYALDPANAYIKIISPTAAASTLNGRWFFQIGVFTGHIHNVIAAYSMAASAIAPMVGSFTTEYRSIKANAQTWMKAAGVLLDTIDPTLGDNGRMDEGQGYGRASMDNFITTMFSLANCLGIDYSAHPRLKGYAENVPLTWPTSLAYYRGTGDDSAIVWRDIAEMTGQRVGGLVQTARSLATSGNTPTTLEQASANCHTFLSPTAEPSSALWSLATMASNEGTASHWSDVTSLNRSGFVLHASPFFTWNHTWAAPLGEYVEHNGQHLVIPASVYDAINTEHQFREGGLAQSCPGVISINGRTTAARASKGGSRFRAVRSAFAWQAQSEAHNVQVTVRDAGPSYGMVPSKPVPGGANVGNGFPFIIATRPSAIAETWTLQCTNAGTGAFSCTGSTSGPQAPWTAGASLQGSSEFVNTFISGKITQGSVPFAVGDTFTITVRNISKMVGTDITIAGVIKLSHVEAARADSGAWERNIPTNDVQTPTSLVVSGGNLLAINHATGHGLPVGATVNVDVSGVTSQPAANAMWPGTVRDANFVDCTVAGLTNATLTGTAAMAVNYSPCTLAGVLHIGNRMRSAGARGVGTVTNLFPSGTNTTNLVGWEHGDNSLVNSSGNAVTHELGSISYRDPRRRVWKNTINAPASTSIFCFTHLWLLAGATLTALTQSTTGSVGSRVSTAEITYNGKIYSITKTENVIAPVVTVRNVDGTPFAAPAFNFSSPQHSGYAIGSRTIPVGVN